MGRVTLRRGDITTCDVDAIVNAANSRLLPGGGVCGAIFAAAGVELLDACTALGGCEVGSARITPGFGLTARHVIHAVAPVWRGGERGEEDLLAAACRSSLALAEKHGLTSIAFPLLGTGTYGIPLDVGARVALRMIRVWSATHALPREVIVVAYDAAAERALVAARDALDGRPATE